MLGVFQNRDQDKNSLGVEVLLRVLEDVLEEDLEPALDDVDRRVVLGLERLDEPLDLVNSRICGRWTRRRRRPR